MATAAIKRTMKRYANAVVELAKAAVLLVLWTSEVVTSMAGTHSCMQRFHKEKSLQELEFEQ